MFEFIFTEEGKRMPLLITVVTEVIQKCWRRWGGEGYEVTTINDVSL